MVTNPLAWGDAMMVQSCMCRSHGPCGHVSFVSETPFELMHSTRRGGVVLLSATLKPSDLYVVDVPLCRDRGESKRMWFAWKELEESPQEKITLSDLIPHHWGL